MTMTRPRHSNENEKDFAPPVKKLKEEEDNSDSVPMSEEEAFEIWCNIYGKVYPDKETKDLRFDMFKQSLDKTTIPSTHALNFRRLADRTEEEVDAFRKLIRRDCYSSISRKELKACKELKAPMPEDDNKPFPVHPEVVAAAAMDLTPREAFKIWCDVYRKEYPNQKEEECRFNLFKQNLVNTLPSNGRSNAVFADLTEQEFREIVERPNCNNRVCLLDLKLCAGMANSAADPLRRCNCLDG